MAKKKPYQRAERQRQLQREAELAATRRQRVVVAVAAALSVLVVIGIVVALTVFGGNDDPVAGQPTETAPTDTPSTPAAPEKPASIPTAIAPTPKRPSPLPATVSCTYTKSAEPASKKVNPPANGKVSATGTQKVLLDSPVGKIPITLNKAIAPCTVNSFISLTKQKYFDNTSCHRLTVTGLQVLQCGDPTGSGSGGPGYSFADEVWPALKYGRGMLAMANAGANTNGSQFFIVYGDASVLEPKYTVFGAVDPSGLAVVDKVARTGANVEQPGTGDGKPALQVQIKTMTLS